MRRYDNHDKTGGAIGFEGMRHISGYKHADAFFFFDSYPRPVADMLASAGEVVKHGTLTAVWVSSEGYGEVLFHESIVGMLS